MTENKKAQFLPFHAINEFMRDDFRLTILQEVLSNLKQDRQRKNLTHKPAYSKRGANPWVPK